MKKYYIILTIGLLCLTACNKEDKISEEQNSDKITFIKAKNGDNDSKASVDNTSAAFTWNTGDKVAVYTTDGYKISNGLEATYDGTNAATFAFSDMVEAHRTDFALFPASLVWDGTNIRPNSAANHTSTGLTVTLPASYTLSEVQDEKSPVPMIATNAPNGDLNFKSLCALLRVTVSNVPATTRRLVFVFNGKKVQGEFTLTGVAPGTTSIATTSAEGTNHTLTVFTPDIDAVSTLTINLPLPSGTYDYITISAYESAEGGLPIYTKTRLIKSAGTWTSTRLSSRKISAALSQIAFSVSTTKKVIFAPGNLQATYDADAVGEKWTWSFATNQYGYIGNNSGNRLVNGTGTLSGDGTVDLFFYSNTGNSYGIAKSYSDGTFSDWGNIDIDGKGSGYWRSLSGGNENSEWWYVFHNKDSYNHIGNRTGNRFTQAEINTDGTSVKGVILFPDGFDCGAFSGVTWGTINGNSNFTTTCTTTGWITLEKAGCVFLPTAGYRTANSTSVTNVGSEGLYSYGTYWHRLRFDDEGVDPKENNGRAGAVRLAHNLN